MTHGAVGEEVESFSYGPYVLVPDRQLLLRDRAPVRIGGRALEILTALVERPGEIVGRGELFARVWPGTVVDDSNLKVNVAALRRVLGTETDGLQYIGTVVGRGYRFLVPVHRAGAAPIRTGAPHNLPAATTRVIGRAAVIAEVGRAFAEVRLVSIVGAGGIDKTTTALAVAEVVLGS